MLYICLSNKSTEVGEKEKKGKGKMMGGKKRSRRETTLKLTITQKLSSESSDKLPPKTTNHFLLVKSMYHFLKKITFLKKIKILDHRIVPYSIH